MGKKLYVGNLGYEVDDATLESWFTEHGSVQSATVIMDRATGRSKGFGFVEMGTDAEAQAAISAMDGQEAGGRTIRVAEAKAEGERGGRPGGGGGGGGFRGGRGGGRSGGGGGGGGGGRRDRY